MNIKSILLGTAAAFALATGASAADLPAKAKPVEYVKVCGTYGAGFFVIPGTDTCLKIGGAVQANYYAQDNSLRDLVTLDDIDASDFDNKSYTSVRATVTLDARSATEHGTLRSFTEVRFNLYSASTVSTSLKKAFIQWAGFTFGRTNSMFDFYASANIAGMDPAGLGSDTDTTVLAYTAEFGNGWSATLSLEDGTFRRVATGLPAFLAAPATAPAMYGGHEIPDIVGNIRVDQSWGSLQLSAAARQLIDGASGDDAWGYAVQLGGQFKVGQGSLWLQGAYSKGAVSYGGGLTNILDPTNGALGLVADFVPGSVDSKTEVWSIVAAYSQPFSNSLTFNTWVGYADVSNADPSASPFNFNVWNAGVGLDWAAAKNLTISNQVEYSRMSFDAGDRATAWRYMLGVVRSF
jgi:hypothetical protein